MAPEKMTFDHFFDALTKPTYIYRMARSVAFPFGPQEQAHTPLQRSGRTRMARAQRRIDDLVLQRAAVIADERRCAAVCRGDSKARCEFQRGHGPVGPGRDNPAGAHPVSRRDWDHGAPGAGTWWMEEGSVQV